jgi:hypothetical protein
MNRAFGILVLVLATGCGGEGPDQGPTETTDTTSETVTVRGDVRFPSEGLFIGAAQEEDCGDFDTSAEPTTLTFSDASDRVIGTVSTGGYRLIPQDVENGTLCVPTATYRVDLPRVDFYQAKLDAQLVPQTRSLEDLESTDFVWDFNR